MQTISVRCGDGSSPFLEHKAETACESAVEQAPFPPSSLWLRANVEVSIEMKSSLDRATTVLHADPLGTGWLRSWLNRWKRVEDTIAQMDYGPYDYIADRLHALESRVAELEPRQNPKELS